MDAKGLDLLSSLLSAAQRRQEVLSNNLANAETPGWTRQRVEFESLLAGEMRKSNFDLKNFPAQVVDDNLTPSGPNGNNVHLELEMNAMRENELLYRTYASLLNHRFNSIDAAMRDN